MKCNKEKLSEWLRKNDIGKIEACIYVVMAVCMVVIVIETGVSIIQKF